MGSLKKQCSKCRQWRFAEDFATTSELLVGRVEWSLVCRHCLVERRMFDKPLRQRESPAYDRANRLRYTKAPQRSDNSD